MSNILKEIEDVAENLQLLNEVSNAQIIDKYISGEFPKSKEEANKYGVKTDSFSPIWGSSSLKITRISTDMEEPEIGWGLYFNAMPIMFRDKEGALYFNTTKTGQTSISKVQSSINGFLDTNPNFKENVRTVDNSTIKKLVNNEPVDKGVLDKLSDEIEEPSNTSDDIPSEESNSGEGSETTSEKGEESTEKTDENKDKTPKLPG